MPRRPNPVPNYKKHPTRNEARCSVNGKWVSLGPWNSPESIKAHERICAELRAAAADGRPLAGDPRGGVTVADLIEGFARHAVTHYRRHDGSQTSEVRAFQDALAVVGELYGDTPAAEFGPRALKAVRQRFLDRGWCRTLVNQRIGRVRRVFKWAVGEELIPESVHAALRCVEGLKKGRTSATESKPVVPVDVEHVKVTLPFLSRHVRAMVELQLYTGMRPGEVCAMTLGQIDRTGDVWVYRPAQHKTRHRGMDRVIPLGPKARVVLEAFIEGSGRAAGLFRVIGQDDRLFSPWHAREEAYAAMRAKRKTKVQPSQRSRRKANPVRLPRRYYTTDSYAHAVGGGAEKAGVGHWHPNQIRHTVGTEVRRVYGLEAAGALLGHTKMSATEVYAERDRSLASKVVSEMG